MGDLLVVGSCNGMIRALDKKTGQVRWSYDIRRDGDQTEFHGDPLVTENLIIIGTDGKMGHLYAFERLTGAMRWKYRVDAKSLYWNSSPTVTGGLVYYGGLDGIAYAVHARSGKLVWKTDLGARVSTSVAAHGRDIYVGTANRHLYRLDADSGKVLADFAVDAEPRWRLIVASDSLLAFLGPQTLASFDLSLKGICWSAKASKNWTSARPYVWRDTVLAGDGHGLVAFRASDGTQAWSHQVPEVIRGIGVSDDVLYVGTLKGPVFALAHR